MGTNMFLRALISIGVIFLAAGKADITLGRSPVLSFSDELYDDHGPGTTVYPYDPIYENGIFDLKEISFLELDNGDWQVDISLRTLKKVELDFHVNDNLTLEKRCPQQPCLQTIDIYVKTPNEDDGYKWSLPGRNVIIDREQGWNKCILLVPDPLKMQSELKSFFRRSPSYHSSISLYKNGKKELSQFLRNRFFIPERIRQIGNSLRFILPKSWLGCQINDCGIVVLVCCTELSKKSKSITNIVGLNESAVGIITPKINPTNWEPGGADGSITYPSYLDYIGRSDPLQIRSASSQKTEILSFCYANPSAQSSINQCEQLDDQAASNEKTITKRTHSGTLYQIVSLQKMQMTSFLPKEYQAKIGDLVTVYNDKQDEIGFGVVIDIIVNTPNQALDPSIVVCKYHLHDGKSEEKPCYISYND